MAKRLPKNPEKYFKSTPNEFSDVSRIIEIKKSEGRSGMILDNLEELEKALTFYVSNIREPHISTDEQKDIVSKTMKDVQVSLTAKEKIERGNFEQQIDKLKNYFDELTFLPKNHRNKILLVVKDDLYNGQNLYAGKIYPIGMFDGIKGSDYLKDEISIKINQGKFKFCLTSRPVTGKFMNEEEKIQDLEERIANNLGKQLSIGRASFDIIMSVVDGAWYNISLYDILKDAGFQYRNLSVYKDERESLPLTKKNFQSNMQSNSRGINEHQFLLLKHNRDKFHVCLNIEADCGGGRPDYVKKSLSRDDLSEEEEEELEKIRYTQLRGNNIVGPAWNILERKYGRPKPARLELPVLKFNFCFDKEILSDVPVVDRRIMENLVDARDTVIKRFDKYRVN